MRGIAHYLIYLPQITKNEIHLDDGTILYLDASFNPVENRIPKAKVLAIPEHFDTPVQVGDYLYFHHNVVRNEKFYVDKTTYAVPADPADPLCYAYERDGKVEMLYDYMFLTPGEENVDSERSGIALNLKKDSVREGTIRYANREQLDKLHAEIGDRVNFRRFRNAKYDIHGEQLFRVKVKDINWIYNAEEA